MLQLTQQEHLDGAVVDSYRNFMKGAYRAIKFGKRHWRVVGRPPVEVERGFVESVNEVIDKTVIDRWQKDSSYRPENLRSWAEQANVDLKSLPVADTKAR